MSHWTIHENVVLTLHGPPRERRSSDAPIQLASSTRETSTWKARLLSTVRAFVFGGEQVARRDALVLEFIANLPPGSKLVDAGAGPQRFREFCRHLNYTSQDFGEYGGGDDFAGRRLEPWNSRSCDIISDITAIPLPDGSVDSIMCVEVFEHLPEPTLALKEFSRLLRANGRVLITAPFNSQYHQTPFFFYSGFSSEFYKHHSSQHGLEMVRITPTGDYYSTLAQELLRLPFLKSGLLLKVAAMLTLPPAYVCVWLMHVAGVPAPRSPQCYVVELRKR